MPVPENREPSEESVLNYIPIFCMHLEKCLLDLFGYFLCLNPGFLWDKYLVENGRGIMEVEMKKNKICSE
jgi:hypothetical protein